MERLALSRSALAKVEEGRKVAHQDPRGRVVSTAEGSWAVARIRALSSGKHEPKPEEPA